MRRLKVPTVKCPNCLSQDNTYKVDDLPPGFRGMQHWCCSTCKLGWYQYPGERGKVHGSRESARAAYRKRRAK